MNRLSAPAKLCAPAPAGRAPAREPRPAGSEAEAAAFCAMKLAEAERQARDGRRAVCCG